jgi:SAM-dependent methyltransferase
MTLQPLAAHEIAGAYAVSIARSLARIAVKRMRRTPERVAAEYEAGRWADILRARAWERAPSLEAFLVGSSARPVNAVVDGRICRLSEAAYLRHRLGALQDLVARGLGRDRELVELGCGHGYNLFALSLAFPQRRFIGLDISPTGIAAARGIAAWFGLAHRITFDVIDLTDPQSANFVQLRDRAVLTFFCLEQVPAHVEAVLQSIAAARPARVLNAEPAAEMLSLRRPSDWANILYVRSMHYQRNLLSGLERMRDKGTIELITTSRLAFAPTIQQVGLAAVWAPGPDAHARSADAQAWRHGELP